MQNKKIRDPCTMQDLGTVKAYSKTDVLDAVARAKAAQAKWKTSSFVAFCRICSRTLTLQKRKKMKKQIYILQAKWKTSTFDQRRHLLHVISRCITENMVCILLYLYRGDLYILCMVLLYIVCIIRPDVHDTPSISLISLHNMSRIHNMYRYTF